MILSGPPRSLRGRISVANTGPERLVIKGALLHLPKQSPIPVQLTALVGPGATVDSVVSIDLGPGWPAGTSRGELEVNEQRRDVEVHVVPTIGIDVTPGELLAAEGTTTITLDLRNVGNVTLPLARTTRGRLVAHDSGDPHVDSSHDATLRLARAVTLKPGESASLSAEVLVPPGLASDRRHRAHLPIGPADLVVTVLPVDPPAKSRKRAAPTKES